MHFCSFHNAENSSFSENILSPIAERTNQEPENVRNDANNNNNTNNDKTVEVHRLITFFISLFPRSFVSSSIHYTVSCLSSSFLLLFLFLFIFLFLRHHYHLLLLLLPLLLLLQLISFIYLFLLLLFHFFPVIVVFLSPLFTLSSLTTVLYSSL